MSKKHTGMRWRWTGAGGVVYTMTGHKHNHSDKKQNEPGAVSWNWNYESQETNRGREVDLASQSWLNPGLRPSQEEEVQLGPTMREQLW